jgi:hypothetical protein
MPTHHAKILGLRLRSETEAFEVHLRERRSGNRERLLGLAAHSIDLSGQLEYLLSLLDISLFAEQLRERDLDDQPTAACFRVAEI